MANENVKSSHMVEYELINGSGQLIFAKGVSYCVCGVHIPDENQKEEYLRNLDKTRGHPNVARLENFDSKKNIILLEGISGTLRDFVSESSKTSLWDNVKVIDKWRMSPCLQGIIKGILSGVFYLDKLNIHVNITIDNIVFGVGDQHHKIPKIKDLTDYTGNCYLLKMLKGLESLIRQIMKEHKVGINSAAEDVKHLLDKLKKPPSNINADYLGNHPALKREGGKLDYIRDVRDGYRENKLGGVKEAEKYRNTVFQNWITEVEKYEHLNGMMVYEKNALKKTHRNTLIELVYFIRNAKEHLNEEVTRCEAREAASTSTRVKVVQYSPLPKGNTGYTDLEIELIFEILFPSLVNHIYDHIVWLR